MTEQEITTTVELHPASEANMGSLLAGIIGDLQELVAQQMRLTQREIATNLRRRRASAVILSSGLMAAFLACLMLSFSAAYWLHEMTAPVGSDPAVLSLGASFAIVSLVLLLCSGGLMFLGLRMLQAIPPWQNLADELFPGKTP